MNGKGYSNKKINKLIFKEDVIFTRKRSIEISNKMLNKIFYIYNGKSFFNRIRIVDYLIDLNLKLGEFCSTRQVHIFKKKKKKAGKRSKTSKK